MLGDYCGSPWFHPLGIVGQTSPNFSGQHHYPFEFEDEC